MGERTVYVVGATGELGSVVGRAFARAGWRLALGARHREPLEMLREELSATGAEVVASAFDAADQGAVDAALARWEGALGPPDACLHLAGAYLGGRSADAWSEEEWESQWRANALGPALVLSRVLGRLRAVRRPGVLVGVGATAGIESPARKLPYGVSKAALRQLIRGLSEEGAELGVRAHLVIPTVIDTRANRQAMPDADRSEWVLPDVLAELLLQLAEGRSMASLPREIRL